MGPTFSDYSIFSVGYKIPNEVTFCSRMSKSLQKNHYVLAYECEVYSSSTSAWETISPVPCAPIGKIYWLSSFF